MMSAQISPGKTPNKKPNPTRNQFTDSLGEDGFLILTG